MTTNLLVFTALPLLIGLTAAVGLLIAEHRGEHLP
ncbi:hypothetical protein MTDSW087_03914 [Methylobacterium dankookense]|uniref:Uncharacterized protein n=1 Tax=Methylobacterium dankookense TaxID=560405 RepID=A0A564G2L5_9HYPH|nr:hypothetical protein IFDJLNFL_4756 [Methylobacterium dankookense]VUF14198.1 hypothetical protein MTDSW087_03914 [Methylobacterium dankookense]